MTDTHDYFAPGRVRRREIIGQIIEEARSQATAPQVGDRVPADRVPPTAAELEKLARQKSTRRKGSR